MIYALFRWLTGIALHWFYSSIQVTGKEQIPAIGPVLLAASHHNALVDALVAVWMSSRPLTLTAKATLMENALLAWLLSLVGVVPLRRAADEKKKQQSAAIDASRNKVSFDSLHAVLERGGVILIFPEGRSHSEPELAPLRTGIARIALEARDLRAVAGLKIVPVGLSFEDKGNPGTAVLAEVGEPLLLDEMGDATVESLTASITVALRAVSLKVPSPSPDRDAVRRRGGINPLTSPIAAWGELTHRYLINFARDLAVSKSRNPDEPAMLTIIFSLALILVSYVLQFAVVALLVGSMWAILFVATLPLSAYWAAFQAHPRRSE